MAALIVLLIFAIGLYGANKIACRHDVNLLSHVPRRTAQPDIVPAELSASLDWTMAWTYVDDCQFRRLVDGMSTDGV